MHLFCLLADMLFLGEARWTQHRPCTSDGVYQPYTPYLYRLLSGTRRTSFTCGSAMQPIAIDLGGSFSSARRPAIPSRGLDEIKRGDLWRVDGMRKACDNQWPDGGECASGWDGWDRGDGMIDFHFVRSSQVCALSVGVCTCFLNTLIKARVLYIVCGTLGVLGMYSVPSTGYCKC
jgi:hypothetical protein